MKYIITMSGEEMSEFLDSTFNDLEEDPKRCIATMIGLIIDHNQFLKDHNLEEMFDLEYDTQEEELH